MRDIITMLITDFAPVVLSTVITFIVAQVKIKYDKYIDDKTKKDVAATTVKYIEQICKDIHGKEKLEKAKQSMAELLTSKHIDITETEMEILLECAVRDINYSSLSDFVDEVKKGGEI